MSGLAIIETHPIQYHAPVYRAVEQTYGIPVTAIYASDFSVVGYEDHEFGVTFAWDSDLLTGHSTRFLSRVSTGGAQSVNGVRTRGLLKALDEVTPDVVMIVGNSPQFHRTAFLAAWRNGLPILFRAETTDHARRRSAVREWIRDRVLRWAYGRSARLLYVGQLSYQHFMRLGCPEAKLISSPYCVDAKPFHSDEASRERMRPEMRSKLGIGEEDTVLLFSGKCSERKGVDVLMRAVKSLPPETRDHVVLLFLGSGQRRDSLEALSLRPPSVRVRFVGFQNQHELTPYYHASDLLLLPSLHSETWGLVVNEALQHGLPAVVSRAVGCAPDLIEDGVTGEVCETGSVAGLAAAIERALRLVGRIEVRTHCRQLVNGYSVPKAAEGIARAYREALEERRRASDTAGVT